MKALGTLRFAGLATILSAACGETFDADSREGVGGSAGLGVFGTDGAEAAGGTSGGADRESGAAGLLDELAGEMGGGTVWSVPFAGILAPFEKKGTVRRSA